MGSIKLTLGGKGVGIADQASVDPMRGCPNRCKGCYAAKTSRMGQKFYTCEPVVKEYNDADFKNSCKLAHRKGIRFARLGKHTDPGADLCIGVTHQILEGSSSEGIRLIFVSKSLGYSNRTAELMRAGNHILHVSRGMITEGPSEAEREVAFAAYRAAGVSTFQRVVADVTKECEFYLNGFENECIITPMRFSSKEDAAIYNADLANYKYQNGFYRPNFMHESWNKFGLICGEIGDRVFCCNCGTGETND